MLYRLYTEDINQDRIIEIVSSHFEGFTLLSGQGYWKGETRIYQEQSVIIEIVSDCKLDQIVKLAELIKIENSQESVLIQAIDNSQFYV